MNITGSVKIGGIGSQPIALQRASGAFTATESGRYMTRSENSGNQPSLLNFTASRNWTGSTSSNGNHAHTLTVTKDASIYGNSTTVQPNALKIRVKTKAK